jgi:hypothetical protein
MCSCGKNREPGRYYNEKKGFSIEFPDKWEIKKGDGVETPLVEAVSPWENEDDPFSEFISVDVEEFSEEIDLGKYAARLRQDQVGEFQYYEEIDRGETTINGVDAKITVYDIGMEEGTNRVLGFVLVKGMRGYLISCVAEDTKFSEYRETFEEAVFSFRFE